MRVKAVYEYVCTYEVEVADGATEHETWQTADEWLDANRAEVFESVIEDFIAGHGLSLREVRA